ncbi:DUF3108 domain-containing protein [Wenyingzhuangia sp. IMCC45533]
MKYIISLLCFISFGLYAQNHQAYKSGEKIKFRIHYGIVNAGYASIEVKDKIIDSEPYEHVVGKGWTSGMLKWVFYVDDQYESFIHKKTGYPTRAIRKVKEGGHTKNVELFFEKDSVLTVDHKRNKEKRVAAKNVHDMIAAFYYLRNNVPDSLDVNQSVEIDMFFDHKKFPFKLVKTGKETLKTKFGKVACFVFKPMVQSGRVFKAKESLSIWITADKNRIPIRIQADLAVGALKADIDKYEGLAHPFKTL